uniref:SH3 domain-containing protein n=1 Tax=Angiostrongylus cantonensis TaxID=6313 RepID=A0A0K0CVY7_ANGCA
MDNYKDTNYQMGNLATIVLLIFVFVCIVVLYWHFFQKGKENPEEKLQITQREESYKKELDEVLTSFFGGVKKPHPSNGPSKKEYGRQRLKEILSAPGGAPEVKILTVARTSTNIIGKSEKDCWQRSPVEPGTCIAVKENLRKKEVV